MDCLRIIPIDLVVNVTIIYCVDENSVVLGQLASSDANWSWSTMYANEEIK